MNSQKSKKKVLVVDSAHLMKDAKGNYYAMAIYDDSFFARYLSAFDEVGFVGKVKNIDKAKSGDIKIDTSRVEIYGLPWYQGMKKMVLKLPQIIKVCFRATRECDCYIFRVLQLESMFAFLIRKRGVPFAVEVVNDPESWMNFPTLIRHFLVSFLRMMTRKAIGASYVTKNYLQEKYPCATRLRKKKNTKCFESYYSSAELKKEDIKNPKDYGSVPLQKLHMVHVANNICGDIKGHGTVIQIISELQKEGIQVTADFIGDGPSVKEFSAMAAELNVLNCIKFCGRISHREELLNKVRQYDLFVFPTHSEGLPRCVIEACAVGLPCLSSPVCGIPELLGKEYLFQPEDIQGYKNAIIRLMNNPCELSAMSIENIKIAKEYQSDILNKRREEFYMRLRNVIASDGEKSENK